MRKEFSSDANSWSPFRIPHSHVLVGHVPLVVTSHLQWCFICEVIPRYPLSPSPFWIHSQERLSSAHFFIPEIFFRIFLQLNQWLDTDFGPFLLIASLLHQSALAVEGVGWRLDWRVHRSIAVASGCQRWWRAAVRGCTGVVGASVLRVGNLQVQ